MSTSLIVVGVGAVVATAATAVLAARCVRSPRVFLISWTVACFALAVALAAQALGYRAGYSPLTFRGMELTAQLAAPIALCVGLSELTAKSLPARFAVRLLLAAIGIIAAVILAIDPLNASASFSKQWPDPFYYYQLVPAYLIEYLLAPVTALIAVAGVLGTAIRSGRDPGARARLAAVGAAALAVLALAALGLAELARRYHLLAAAIPARQLVALSCGLAAVLACLAGIRASRVGVPPRVAAESAADRRGAGREAGTAGPSGDSERRPAREAGAGGDAWDRYFQDAPGGRGDRDEKRPRVSARGRGRHAGTPQAEPQADRDYTADFSWYARDSRELTGLGGTASYYPAAGPDPGPDEPGSPGGRGHDGGLGSSAGEPGGGEPASFSGAAGYLEPGRFSGMAGYAEPAGFSGTAGYAEPAAYPEAGGHPGEPGMPGALGVDEPLAGGVPYSDAGYPDPAGLAGAGPYAGDGYAGPADGYGEPADGYAGPADGYGEPADGYAGLTTGYGEPPDDYQGLSGDAGLASGASAGSGAGSGPESGYPPPGHPSAQLFGQIAIYTLLEERAGDFDRLTERVVAEVRAREPDTLVYIVHGVPTAPLQRILYEVYRDRAAYDLHRRQPYVVRFEAERRPYVLATNVIELGLQQAKVSPFPSLHDILDQTGITPAQVAVPGGRADRHLDHQVPSARTGHDSAPGPSEHYGAAREYR